MSKPGRQRLGRPPGWLLRKSWRSVVGQGQVHPSSSPPHPNGVHGSPSTSCSPRHSFSPHYSTPHSSSLHRFSSPPEATAASRKRLWALGRGVTCLGFILFALSALESEWGQRVKATGELQLLFNPLWVTCPHQSCHSTLLDQTILLMLSAVLVGDVTHGLFGPKVMQYTWAFYCVWLDAVVFLIAGFFCLFSHGDPGRCCRLSGCQLDFPNWSSKTASADLDPRHPGKSLLSSFQNRTMNPRVTSNSPHRHSVSSHGWRNPRNSPLSSISSPQSDIPEVSI
ncbi:uncharacterized protein LOC119947057 isoform X2 [Tachyglossus aculeatus]|uniref:uncharacterized protein LOC119947057 isoform X2 n=1 Tax=Tachyglossus aculeatus TaxID=9261 RepID=UPI0018F27DA8|nr:uncharacterized protein LOC119947057 isoform X2 [Tachyglossus aculeatus]